MKTPVAVDQDRRREDVKAIAAEVVRLLTPPITKDSPETQALFRSRTAQHALSASLNRPTPPNVKDDGTIDEDTMPTLKRDGLDGALDDFVGAANREARFGGREPAFDDVSTDAVISAIAQRLLDRHGR